MESTNKYEIQFQNKKKGGETEIESPKSKGKNKEKKISQSEDGDKTEPTLQEIERSKRLQRKQMQVNLISRF